MEMRVIFIGVGVGPWRAERRGKFKFESSYVLLKKWCIEWIKYHFFTHVFTFEHALNV